MFHRTLQEQPFSGKKVIKILGLFCFYLTQLMSVLPCRDPPQPLGAAKIGTLGVEEAMESGREI